MIVALTVKRENFCFEYTVDRNGTQAAIRAGFSEKTAQAQSSQMLATIEVQLFIADVDAGTRKKREFGKAEVLRELERIAGFDSRNLYDVDGRLKRIPDMDDDTAAVVAGVEPTKFGSKLKINDKMGALRELAKHHGVYDEHTSVAMVVNFSGKFQNV